MTKVKISWREAFKLTPTIRELQGYGYEVTQRCASSGSNDPVFGLRNRATQFHLEYTVKFVEGRNFVNWAQVSGDEATVQSFLTAIGYQEPVINIKQPEL